MADVGRMDPYDAVTISASRESESKSESDSISLSGRFLLTILCIGA